MSNAKEIVALAIMAALATGLIVRLDKTTEFAGTVMSRFDGILRTLSGTGSNRPVN